jgi:hypothetical protein
LSRLAPSNLADNARKLCPAITRIVAMTLINCPQQKEGRDETIKDPTYSATNELVRR